MDLEQQQSQLKLLIAKGKDQGYLTYHEVNDHLPEGIVDPEQIEDIISMINDMGIAVHEVPPDADALLLMDQAVNDTDTEEEAAAALATLDSEFGRTTDPVRMYMREMGTVDLLTREGEIKIAKRIEKGLNQALRALAEFPRTVEALISGSTGASRRERPQAHRRHLELHRPDPRGQGPEPILPASKRNPEDEKDERGSGARAISGPDPEEARGTLSKARVPLSPSWLRSLASKRGLAYTRRRHEIRVSQWPINCSSSSSLPNCWNASRNDCAAQSDASAPMNAG